MSKLFSILAVALCKIVRSLRCGLFGPSSSADSVFKVTFSAIPEKVFPEGAGVKFELMGSVKSFPTTEGKSKDILNGEKGTIVKVIATQEYVVDRARPLLTHVIDTYEYHVDVGLGDNETIVTQVTGKDIFSVSHAEVDEETSDKIFRAVRDSLRKYKMDLRILTDVQKRDFRKKCEDHFFNGLSERDRVFLMQFLQMHPELEFLYDWDDWKTMLKRNDTLIKQYM